MQEVLRSYLRKLTNLSGNNRSLLLSRIITDQCIDIHDFDFALNEPSFHIIDSLIQQKLKTPLCDVLDARDQSSNKLSERLRKLERMDQLILEERGARDLYVGWPFVQGKFTDGTVVRAPLLFFPVAIRKEKDQWILVLRKDVNLTLNKSFLLAYSYFNKAELKEALIERVFDDFDKESNAFRTELYELLKEHNLEINFNSDNFQDLLLSFNNYKKVDLERETKQGELKLFPQAVLGIFPQAGSYLVPDYVNLLEKVKVEKMEDLFQSSQAISNRNGGLFLNELKEENSYTPFEMDAYQENAIRAVKKGYSLVVQGPPGTGKSQLICNLISDHIARGRTVLMVCQKRAALNVVYDRLKTKLIDRFIGLVHDFKNDRKSIYEQLNYQIEKLDEYQARNTSLDTVHLERRFLQVSRKIDQLSEELNDYKNVLFDTTDCGKSIKELYLTSNPNRKSISLKQETSHLDFGNLAEFEHRLYRYLELGEKFTKEGYPLKDRKSFANFGVSDYQEIRNVIDEVPSIDRLIRTQIKEQTGLYIDFDTALAIIDKKPVIDNMLSALKPPEAYRYFVHMVSVDGKIDPLGLSNAERLVLQCFNGVGPETNLKTDELGKFQEALQRTLDATNRLWSWARWKLFSKDKTWIKKILKLNELKYSRSGIRILVEKVDNRLNLEHNITKIYGKKWLIDFPPTFRKIDYQNWFYYQKLALTERNKLLSIRTLKEYFPIQKIEYEEFVGRTTDFLRILGIIPTKLGEWERYLSHTQINTLIREPEKQDFYLKRLRKDFDALCEYDSIWEGFKEHEKSTINKIVEVVFPMDKEEAVAIFNNSVRLAWIDHIENKYPILRTISSGKLRMMEHDLREAVEEKGAISNEILLIKARERTYRNLVYNRLKNLVTYRDLKHQVNKKRRIWPLRKVLANFSEEVFDLIPCWLCSPESASAIFPMDSNIFDLVIFDEASQCFAEKGIPTIFRGKQIVITGDDKQLKPNDLYKVRWEDENENETPELEVDSLLDLGKHFLMEVTLKGHYRSKSLDLIDFSNKYFYRGDLKLTPDFKLINAQESAVHYTHVDGIWDENSNLEEAREIARQALDLVEKDAEKEIGIVTFNAAQQMLILDQLEIRAHALNMTVPSTLIVKNIENIQGDEKDVIFFSIGYAPNKKGKMTANFGSLNGEGGENRLNVAVTRAREQVIVVTSVWPHELKVEDTKNEGPKLLKKYLEYVKSISDGKYQPTLIESAKYPEGWYLKKRLEKLLPESYTTSREIALADLTIKKEKGYHSVILTDDERYFDAISPKDAHVYTPSILRQKNWETLSFSSRELWIDEEEVEEIMKVKFKPTEDKGDE